jgi:hypothetical protein
VNTTKITKTTNEILFCPLGTMIPELSWATLRIKIDINKMLGETEQLCKAAFFMKQEENRIMKQFGSPLAPRQIHKPNHHLIYVMTQDIHRDCNENTAIIEELISVFNLKNIKNPTYAKKIKKITRNNKKKQSVRNTNILERIKDKSLSPQ